MKNTTKKPAFIPAGSLPLNQYIQTVCQKNDLKQAYLIIRSKCPVTFKQVKTAFKMINNN
jgi:hypothetical protein